MDFLRAHLPKVRGPNDGAGNGLPRRVIISYVLDYAILLLLYIVFQSLDAVEPFHQHFALQNYTLQYPYSRHERVPIGLALTISVIVPIIIIAIYTILIDGIFSHRSEPRATGGRGRYTIRERLWQLNSGVLGLLLSEGAAFVITGALKNAVGKPRPDLISRCLPPAGSKDPPLFGLSNSTICTQSDHGILKDGFRSFPSGHSSSAFAGLFYLSLYLAAKLHVLDNNGEVWRSFIVMVPTLGAALIASSRIMDARHHPFDVISGSLLGILVAYFAYRQYFPPVTEPWHRGRAHPIRSFATGPRKPHHRYLNDPRNKSPVAPSHISHDPEAAVLHARPMPLDPDESKYSRGRDVPRISPMRGTNAHDLASSTSSMELRDIRPAFTQNGRRYLQHQDDSLSSAESSRDSSVTGADPERTPRQLQYPVQPRDFTEDTAYRTQPHQIPLELPELQEHSRYEPPSQPPLQRPSHDSFAGSRTTQHAVDHYVCGHCGARVRSEEDLQIHTNVHHPEPRQNVS